MRLVYAGDVGRAWNFLKKDAGAALDVLAEPYARFVVRHRLVMWLIYAGIFALI